MESQKWSCTKSGKSLAIFGRMLLPAGSKCSFLLEDGLLAALLDKNFLNEKGFSLFPAFFFGFSVVCVSEKKK